MDLRIDVEAQAAAVRLPGDGADLIGFLSFAVSRGFGAVHPAIALADYLHDNHRTPFGPLTTFYEADPADAEDLEKIELAWQAAGPLAAAFDALVAGLADPETEVFLRRASLPGLRCQAAAAAGALSELGPAERVRMVFRL